MQLDFTTRLCACGCGASLKQPRYPSQQRRYAHGHSSRCRPLITDRFWSKVNKEGPIPKHCPELGPCWVWTGNVDAHGYGGLGHHERAHRVAWTIAFGPIPQGKSVLHHCDNPPCVRADGHLFLGTQVVNLADMQAKGRGRNGLVEPTKPLLDAIVAEHTALKTPVRILARKYGVGRWRITRLIYGPYHRPDHHMGPRAEN